MGLLNSTGGNGSLAGALAGGVSPLDQAINATSNGQFQQTNGFALPPVPSGDGNGLPSQKVQSRLLGTATRNIAHWFVPEVGIVSMYVNPQSIAYSHRKLITPERTKGGFVIQYWGEDLTTLGIRGHTGSSGVEGLNVLYEIYRAEQIMFDPLALTMAADNSTSGLGDLVDSALGSLGGIGNTIGSVTSGLMGLDPASQNILPRNIPSLASMALGVELYYNGWVFRGYFTSMNYTESAERIGIFDYDINFTVTERRGYRTNSFPWMHPATQGPSNWGVVPLTFESLATASTGPVNTAVANAQRGPFSG